MRIEITICENKIPVLHDSHVISYYLRQFKIINLTLYVGMTWLLASLAIASIRL